jgi:hypothetical protein
VVEAAIAALDCISDADADASFRYSLNLLPQDERVNVAAAHVAHYCHRGNVGRARETIRAYASLGWTEKGEFPKSVRMLDDTDKKRQCGDVSRD